MNRQRILKEAQKIAAKFSFWMVSGNIAHLYGYAYETPEQKYEMEIKFDESFPNTPPQLLYHDEIKELLGDFQLNKVRSWTPETTVVDIIHELKAKIQEGLQAPKIIEQQQLVPIVEAIDVSVPIQPDIPLTSEINGGSPEKEDYLTPDLNAYPAEYPDNSYVTPSNLYDDSTHEEQPAITPSEPSSSITNESTESKPDTTSQSSAAIESGEPSLAINTELGLIQQSYAYDQKGNNKADINIYITITLSKTFIIGIDFTNYPERPMVTFPEEINNMLGDPFQFLSSLKKWNAKKAPHIVDILHELETKLFFVKDIELEAKKILGEYQCDMVANSVTQLKIHLLTYGFKEYLFNLDLGSYPKPPELDLTSELEQIIQIPITELNSFKNWKETESEPIEIVREIAWLVDKNSRINFEIELLRDHYKDIKYDPATETLRIDMKGKMRTQDLTFEFQINLPREYPMKLPEIKVLNEEFELETHEKIRNDLKTSFKDFFNDWTPFSYLVDLFDTISNKIFEVSVTSCVICHKIECPTCSQKIAGKDSCHTECPYCERAYHNHCWHQTISSFGKCGFCLKTPPPSMM